MHRHTLAHIIHIENEQKIRVLYIHNYMLLMAEPIQNPKPYLKRFDKANTATEPSEASRQTLSKLKHPYVSFVFIIGHASCGLARTIATTPHRFFFQCLYVECDSTLPFMGIETFDR